MEKLTYEKAMSYFYDELLKIKEDMESHGYKGEWVLKVPEINENTAFLPKGKTRTGVKCYMSSCPEYTGIYLCGGFSALSCDAVSELLPGTVKDIYCTKNPETCPLKRS